jgi:WD40 repeat protein
MVQFIDLQWTDLSTQQSRRATFRLPVTIGRAEESDLVLSDPKVSRRHAVIQQDRSRIVITDLRSSNGTRLDDQFVQRAALADGATIQLGLTTLKIFLERPTALVRETTRSAMPRDVRDHTAIFASDDAVGDRRPSACGETHLIAIWGKGRITDIAWSPGGDALVVASTLGVERYEARSLEPQQFIAFQEPVEQIGFAGAETTLLAVTARTVAHVDFAQGSVGSLAIRQPYLAANLAISPTGAAIALALGEEVQILRASDGVQLQSLPIDTRSPRGCLAFSPDGQLLAAASAAEIQVWHVAEGTLLSSATADTARVTSMAFSPDSRVLAVAQGNVLTIRDIRQGELIHITAESPDGFGRTIFAPDGRTLAATDGAALHIWRSDDGVLLRTLNVPGADLLAITFSPDGQHLAAATSTSVHIWRVRDGMLIQALAGYLGCVDDLAFAPDGQTLTTPSETIPLRCLFDGARPHAISAAARLSTDSVVGPERPMVIVAARAAASSVAPSPHSELPVQHIPPGRLAEAYDIAFAPNADVLAVLSATAVDLWRGSEDTPSTTIRIDTEANSIALASDGRMLAISMEETIQIWQSATREHLNTLGTGAHWLLFSPDGLTLAAAKGAIVHIWSVPNGRLLATLTGHVGVITCIAFAPGGRVLATGADDGTIRVWSW